MADCNSDPCRGWGLGVAKKKPAQSEQAAWQAPFTDAEQNDLGLRPVTEGGFLYCGVTVQEFAIGNVTYKWPASVKKLKWSLNFSRLGGLSDMDFKDAATQWLKEISDCCDRQFEYTTNTRLANILYTMERLDGSSGVLADMQIPVGNLNESSQLLGRFDDSEGWVLSNNPGQGQIDLYRVGLHETEHAMGLGHKPSNVAAPALIAPIYSPTLRNLQAADIAELQRRYGKPTTSSPPPAAPPIDGKVFSFTDGDESYQVAIGFPSDKTVSGKIDIKKGSRTTTLSGSKPW